MRGFVIKIQYLERAFGTNTYLIDKVTGSLFTLHDDHIESTGLCGSECVFDLQELEFHICDLADQRNREDDTGSVAEERQTTQAPQHQSPNAPPSPGPTDNSRQFFLCMKIGKILHTKVNHSPFHIDNKYTKPVVK